jgi:hypothetical protein
MLRQRHPNQNAPFNIQQQRMQMLQNQNRQPMHPLQQRQMMFRARMGGKPGMINQQAAAGAGINPMVQQTPGNMMQGGQQGMMAGGNQTQGIMNQQNPNMGMAQQNPNVMQVAQPQQTILPGPSSGGIMPQNNVVPNMMVNQNVNQQPQQAAQMIGNIMNQQQNMMQQNVGNQMGNVPNQMVPGATNQNQNQNMFPNQYQNMNQNYSGYNNPTMGGNQANVQGQAQNAMMGNFQQNTPIAAQQQQRNPQADFLAQQRRQYLQQQQQQQQQPQQQQTPNVTMNTNMAVGPQGNVPPPYRQGGKPMVNPNTQQFQEMRRQMMLKQQQQQQQGKYFETLFRENIIIVNHPVSFRNGSTAEQP